MAESVIKAQNINKQVLTNQEHLTILQEVNIDIKRGESIAILGSSGAGKSTLMTLLAGLDVPTSGSVELLGQSIGSLDDEQRAALRSESIGFIFQSFLLLPSLTALENVTLPCLLQGKKENIERATLLLEQVGLKERITHRPSQLSGGEQQRVAIARAFMNQPSILFADEPTGNLDQQTAATIIELLFELNRKNNTTLVLVTHDAELAKRCARKVFMRSGCLEEV